ncbi:hypothetical protein Pyn_29568 [Prunus yedoensis var. nudiflora]|uniref:Uncharacterized protein n=1 Tax=Prunus yedoensis var. nudiflora TaxID=2094558 RepID=A0A314UCY7_PRUYE|nr:hypothetical protein Pyn_29568 [Prunus yedoensis var. nudiflora]
MSMAYYNTREIQGKQAHDPIFIEKMKSKSSSSSSCSSSSSSSSSPSPPSSPSSSSSIIAIAPNRSVCSRAGDRRCRSIRACYSRMPPIKRCTKCDPREIQLHSLLVAAQDL